MLFWPSDSLYPVYSTVGNQVAVMKAGAVVIKDESENIVAKELLMSLIVYAQLTCGFPWLMGEKF